MSLKNCSLAYDDVVELTRGAFAPELDSIVDGEKVYHADFSSNKQADVAFIGGQITISF